ncbi:transcriptional regulator, AbrB family (plasmid) [Rickettsiales bacterium Ac37b]|nr:transcriptional regulator, AbrB family [Rickettsiales bacterium Ac37b]
MYDSLITSKGQTTIPSELRAQLNLKPGDRINYIMHGDYVMIVPANKSLKSLKGILPKPSKSLSLEEMDAVIKDRIYDRN